MRRVAPAVGLDPRVASGQLADECLVAFALFEQRRQRLRHQSLAVAAHAGSQLGDRFSGAARCPDGLGRDVEVHHDAGIHGGEIEFGDVFVQAENGRVDQAALVGQAQIVAAFERFRLAFLPGHHHAAAQGGVGLHGADTGSGGDARRGLHG